MADLLRQHHDGYDPAEGEICTNICMHGGPFPTRFWQACGAMISEATPEGAMAWVTATSGTCVSIFKPMYFGIPAPDMGPVPQEIYTEGSLWWKHENLHRRAMGDFHSLGAEIRKSFEALETGWFAEGRKLIAPRRGRRASSPPNAGARPARRPTAGSPIWSAAMSASPMPGCATCGTASTAPPRCRSCSKPAVASG